MLILTHTWILREYIKKHFKRKNCKQLYAYNIVPDILSVHKSITSSATHAIRKRKKIPEGFKEAAFVQFHLLVDDIAHHGEILSKTSVKKFNPNSKGYSYVKGKKLIEQVMELHKSLGEAISFTRASYESHMIVEMAFDVVINREKNNQELTMLLYEALQDIMKNRMGKFCKILSWYYGINEKIITDAMNQAFALCKIETLNAFMGMEGKVNLYAGKFSLDKKNPLVREEISSLMLNGIALVSDYGDFLAKAITAIEDYRFNDLL
jgi:hypothetical protein